MLSQQIFLGQGSAAVAAVYQTDLFIDTSEADGTTVTDVIADAAIAGRFPELWTGTAPINTGDPAMWAFGASTAADPTFSIWEGANIVHG